MPLSMHRAAPVSYPAGPGPVAIGLQAAAGSLGVGTSAAALWLQDGSPWRTAVLAAASVAAACAVGSAMRKGGPARHLPLHFDGRAWKLGGQAQARAPVVCLDLPGVLLVRLHACKRWVWLERASAPGAWHALRQALFCGDVQPDPARATNERPAA